MPKAWTIIRKVENVQWKAQKSNRKNEIKHLEPECKIIKNALRSQSSIEASGKWQGIKQTSTDINCTI